MMIPRSLFARKFALGVFVVGIGIAPRSGWAQTDAAAAEAPPILIKAGKIYLEPGRVIENGAILVRDGIIAAVGADVEAPDGARILDRPNAVVTAGLIDANATVGIINRTAAAEHRSEVIPELSVIDTIDLDSPAFKRLANAGVTTVYISADSASVIGAQGTVVRTGGSAAGRIVRPAYGIKATLGREPIFKASRNRTPRGTVSSLTRRPNTRMGLVWVFRKAFHDAQAFSRGAAPPTRGEGSASDASIPFLQGILRGDIPLRIQARSQLDILAAIRLTNEFSLSFTLEEGTEANRCIDELLKNNIPVIYGPLFDAPSGARAGEGRRYRYSTPTALAEAGITFALSACELTGEAALPFQAMYAMRFGLTREQALAAVTTTPAKMLGLDAKTGVISVGGIADLVVWSGEPFSAVTRADVVLIGGTVVKDVSAE